MSAPPGLEPALVGSVLVDAGYIPPRSRGEARAIDVSRLDADLLDDASLRGEREILLPRLKNQNLRPSRSLRLDHGS